MSIGFLEIKNAILKLLKEALLKVVIGSFYTP